MDLTRWSPRPPGVERQFFPAAYLLASREATDPCEDLVEGLDPPFEGLLQWPALPRGSVEPGYENREVVFEDVSRHDVADLVFDPLRLATRRPGNLGHQV